VRNEKESQPQAHMAQKCTKIRQEESHKKFALKSYALGLKVEKNIKQYWLTEIVIGVSLKQALRNNKIFANTQRLFLFRCSLFLSYTKLLCH
jgi:hypothetical protein